MIIDGRQIASKVRGEVAERVKQLRARGVTPGLTVVRVGEDPASAIYVRGKRKACEEAGIASVEHHLPASTTQQELLALVARLNADPSVHGILVQLPLPDQIDEDPALDAIDPRKDSDGFHPFNVGCLWTGHDDLQPAGVPQHAINGRQLLQFVLGRSFAPGRFDPVRVHDAQRHNIVLVHG